MHVKNLVVVLSTIKTAPGRLTYAPRSVFSHAERLEQTKTTLVSVREKIPDSHILFVDATGGEELRDRFDIWLQPRDAVVLQEVNSPIKGLGEAALLEFALEWISKCETLTFDNLWKINGRYSLMRDFCIDRWNSTLSQAHFYNPISVCTVLYKICPEDFSAFKKFVSESKTKFCGQVPPGMETIYSTFPFCHIPVLGVCGKVAVSGEDWTR
jgi:hypothetical protein